MPVATERERGGDAAVVAAKISDHMPPERRVHDQPVGEDQNGAITTRVLVIDDSRRELNL
jgi:hypothetical protein